MAGLAAVLVGIALGIACGGSLRRLEDTRLRFAWPVLIVFVVQGVARGRIAGASPSALGVVVWVLSCVALLALLLPEWRRDGVWIAGLGIALNLLVVLLNGGMPIAQEGLTARIDATPTTVLSKGFYQMAGPGTLFGAAGDVLPFFTSGYRILASPGDVLLALGVAILVVGGTMGRHGPQSAAPPTA